MKNEKRIEEFLQYFAKIGAQNPYYSFDTESACRQIYHELITRDVSNEDKQISLAEQFGSPFKDDYDYDERAEEQYKNSVFYKWIEYYKRSSRIDVFRSEYWPYFCQFISKDQRARASKEHIKVYIPQDGKHIEKSAKLIFDFLSRNDIPHVSKIGKQIRFDDIVIRLVNEEDARKLLDFVKSNQYLQEGMIKPNPFAFQQDGVAMACDGDQSYNYTVAQIVAMYLDSKKKSNSLDTVSYQDFYHFISENFKKEFINNSSTLFERKLGIEDEKSKKNYQHIIALMLKSQSNDFTLDNYFDHYRHSKNSKEKKKELDTNIQQLLAEVMDTMSRKYNEEAAITNVDAYLRTGDADLITRDNNLRERVRNSGLREQLVQMLNEKDITLKEYVQEKGLGKKEIFDSNALLAEALEESARRFNNDGVRQVKAYILTGDEKFITRNNNLRERVVKSPFREEIISRLKKDSISFEEYVRKQLPYYPINQESAKK